MEHSSTRMVLGTAFLSLGTLIAISCSESSDPNANDGGGGGVADPPASSGGSDGVGGAGSSASTMCAEELRSATSLVGAASDCEQASECRLVLTESVTLSAELGNNESGYVVLREDSDEKPVVEAARVLNDCEGAFGPSGAGLDDSRVDCVQGSCAYTDP